MNKNQQFDRQIKFILYYIDRGSDTYNNLTRAAIKAGYRKSYARKIGSQLNWGEMEESLLVVKDELERFLQARV